MRPADRLRDLATACAAGLLLLAVGCGEPHERGPAPAGIVTSEARSDAHAAAEAVEPSAPDLPGPGSVLVEASGRGYNVLANAATQLRVLEELERVVGFELSVATGADLAADVTLALVDASVGEILIAVLGGFPFSLSFAVSEPDPRPYLQRVAVGEDEGDRATRAARLIWGEAADEGDRVAPQRGRAELNPTDEARRAEGRQQLLARWRSPEYALEQQRERERLYLQLDDPDPEKRAESAEWIDSDGGEGVAILTEILELDSSAEVRAAAAENLGDSDSPGAIDALLLAMSDPAPVVVIAALDAIEFLGDETTIPKIVFLLDHEDPEVRERTVEGIDFLE